MFRRSLPLVLLFAITSISVNAEFGINIQKPKVEEAAGRAVDRVPATAFSGQNRQSVMDDGFTFFDAEPVKGRDEAKRLDKDIGWKMQSHLRAIGDFPNRSAFRVVVKRGAKTFYTVRCESQIYKKESDPSLGNELRKKERDLTFENYMQTNSRCRNDEESVKPTGSFDVEVYLIDGDTDEEKLARTYKIDVHRASRVRGSTTNPQPDVAHYYIQRHAEAGVAILLLAEGQSSYFGKPVDTSSSPGFRTLHIYTSYSPARSAKLPQSAYARCSVNGKRIKLDWDQVNFSGNFGGAQEWSVYTDRLTAQYKRGSAYRDDVVFRRMKIKLPLYTEETEYSKPRMKIENTPGNWECQILSNGELYRTFRFVIGTDGKPMPHPEQANGNINLFHNAYLVDMEIPAGGTKYDHRLAPMPNGGLFYGIPWSTPEGKEMASRMPKRGNPFHRPSNKVK